MENIMAAESPNDFARRCLNFYGDSMLKMAYGYLHNYDDAEEIVQDSIMKVLARDLVFRNKAHEKAYILAVVANLSKNKIKYNKLRETDELLDQLVLEERRDLSFVWEAVKELPVTQREVVHLFYSEGYSTMEISKMLGRKEATVRSDLRRARGRLKEILKEDYDFE